jgi:hypothetical protein
VPQLEQNAAAAGWSVPQDGHGDQRPAPHTLQKRASGACSAPHEAQIVTSRV